MAANNLANTKAEVFGSIVQRELLESSNLVQFIEDKSNLAVKGVNVISVPKLTSFTVQDRAFGAAAADNAPLVDSVDSIPLNKNKIVKWVYDAKDALQSSIEYQMEAAGRAGTAHGRDINQKIVDVWKLNAGLNINGAVPADITAENILDMRKFLLQNHADMSKVVFVISADQEKAMLLLPEFSRYEYRGGAESPIVNGLIGRVYNVPVYISQAVPNQQAFMIEKSGTGIGFQAAPAFGEQDDLDYGIGGKKAAVDTLYGVAGLQLEVGVALDNATPLSATESAFIAKLAD